MGVIRAQQRFADSAFWVLTHWNLGASVETRDTQDYCRSIPLLGWSGVASAVERSERTTTMASVLSWTANSVLFAVGCLLAADTADQVIAAALLPSAPTETAPRAAPPPPRSRSWAEREIILTRNLFHSSTDATPVAIKDEDLEKSKLPVTLLGTFAANDPALSRATLMDKEKNETLVVGVGDQIKNTAEVQRIERRRIVLLENGAPRELTFGEDALGAPAIQRANKPRLAARRAVNAARAETPAAVPISRDTINQSMQNPSQLLSQARVLPKFENGQMVGLQVNGIQPGSLFETLGVQEGDVITEFNGISISSPDESARIFSELSSAEQFNVTVRGADGVPRQHTFTPQ
jgi:general secretion pathway protein C